MTSLTKRQTTWGWGLWAGAFLILDALSMGFLVTPGSWLARLVVLLAGQMGVGVGVAVLLRRAPQVLQAIGVFVVLAGLTVGAVMQQALAMTAGQPATQSPWQATAHILGSAFEALRTAVPRVADASLFAPLIMASLGALASFVAVVAIVWREPLVTLVATLAPWAVVFSMRTDAGWTLPAMAALAALAFAAWQAPRQPRHRAARFGGGLAVMASGLAAALLVNTVAPTIAGWGSGLDWLRSQAGGQQANGTIGVSGNFNVNGWLRSGSTRAVAHLDGNYTGPLQVSTRSEFNGVTWLDNPSDQGVDFDSGATLWPTGDPQQARVFPTTAHTTITLTSWTIQELPVGVGPRTFDGLDAQYHPSTDTVVTTDSPDGSSLVEHVKLVNRDRLLGDQTTLPAKDQYDVVVPVTSHTNDLKTLAETLTNGKPTDYDKLMAIQNYLKSPDFTYTLTPTITNPSDDPVWDFLQRRTGYCTHFATAMVVLARLVGIPTRVAVGYSNPTNGVGNITEANAHMWPQAHFADAGWVAFEPTPGANAAVTRPTSQTPRTSPSASSSTSSSHTTSTPTARPTATTSSAPPTTTTGPQSGTTPWPWLLGVAGLVIAGLAWWFTTWWQARPITAVAAWATVSRVARKAGLAGVSTTPAATAKALRQRLTDDTAAQLDELVQAIEHLRYAPPDALTPAADMKISPSVFGLRPAPSTQTPPRRTAWVAGDDGQAAAVAPAQTGAPSLSSKDHGGRTEPWVARAWHKTARAVRSELRHKHAA